MSFDTAGRIRELIDELSLPYGHQYLVGCCFAPEQDDIFQNLSARAGLEALGLIPFDPEIAEKNLAGESLLTLPLDNSALKTAEKLMASLVDGPGWQKGEPPCLSV